MTGQGVAVSADDQRAGCPGLDVVPHERVRRDRAGTAALADRDPDHLRRDVLTAGRRDLSPAQPGEGREDDRGEQWFGDGQDSGKFLLGDRVRDALRAGGSVQFGGGVTVEKPGLARPQVELADVVAVGPDRVPGPAATSQVEQERVDLFGRRVGQTVVELLGEAPEDEGALLDGVLGLGRPQCF